MVVVALECFTYWFGKNHCYENRYKQYHLLPSVSKYVYIGIALSQTLSTLTNFVGKNTNIWITKLV